MDKKKLIKYTKWALKMRGVMHIEDLVKHFLEDNPNFFDEPDAKKEPDPWDELFQSKENQTQTGVLPIGCYVVSGKTPHRCPVCNGNGIVPGGFYTQTSGQWTASTAAENCHSCSGTGIIWSKQ